MVFRLVKDLALFLLVFSIINDNFVVEKIAGPNALKAIFLFFLVVYAKEIILAFTKPKNEVMKFFYFFIFVFAISVFLNVLIQTITLQQGIFVLIPILTVFVFASYYDQFEKLVYYIWASVLVSSVILIFNDPISQWTFRRTGGTGDPNEFAAQVVVTMALTIYLFYKNRNHLFLWGSLGVFLYALLYAGSKSAFLTLTFLIVFTIVAKFRFILKKLFSLKVLVSALVIGAGMFVLIISQTSAVEGMQERAKSAGTAKTRFVSWNAGIRMTQDNFLVGVGPEQYEKHAREYATDFIAKGSLAAHNFLIKMIAENGVFSFFALVLFLIALFSYRFRAIVGSDYFWVYAAASATILMGLTLSMIYDKYFWLFLGLLSHVSLVTWGYNQESEEDIEEEITIYQS